MGITPAQMRHGRQAAGRGRGVRCFAGYEIFKYRNEEHDIRDVKARDLNAYVKEVIGPEFTPKDFRTWAGSLFAAVKLAEISATEDLDQAEKNVLEAVDNG